MIRLILKEKSKEVIKARGIISILYKETYTSFAGIDRNRPTYDFSVKEIKKGGMPKLKLVTKTFQKIYERNTPTYYITESDWDDAAKEEEKDHDVMTFENMPTEKIRKFHPQLADLIEADKRNSLNNVRIRLLELVQKHNPKIREIKYKSSLYRLNDEELEDAMEYGISLEGDLTRQVMIERISNDLNLIDGDDTVATIVNEEKIELKKFEELYEGIDNKRIEIEEEEKKRKEEIKKYKFSDVLNKEEVIQLIQKAHGYDICVIDVKLTCNFTNNIIIANGTSSNHVHLLASVVVHKLKEIMKQYFIKEVSEGKTPQIEGVKGSGWLVVDAGSVIIHLFTEEKRKLYDLESLWGTKNNIRYVEAIKEQKKIETLDTIKLIEEEN